MEIEVVRKPAKIENMFKKSVKELSIFVIQSIFLSQNKTNIVITNTIAPACFSKILYIITNDLLICLNCYLSHF